MQKQSVHIPVLLQEVLDGLSPKKGDTYLDLTAGYGGHASEVLQRTSSAAVLVDRDSNAVDLLKQLFRDTDGVTIMHTDFLSASRQLVDDNQQFDLILADLGISSPHIDVPDRGFSIQQDGPIDMRMDQSQSLTAADIVNTYAFEDIVTLLRDYGQEPKAKRIAQLIVDGRPFTGTTQLAATVKKAWPVGSRSHPATRTFQALRIAVNNELGQLTDALPLWHKLLKPSGKLGVISFHSLEDAIVKRYFREHGGDRYDAELQILTKRPVEAAPNELVFNPRARSARLRIAQKRNIKTKER